MKVVGLITACGFVTFMDWIYNKPKKDNKVVGLITACGFVTIYWCSDSTNC